MKKILVIQANPKADSFCRSLAEKYVEGVTKAGHEVKTLVLTDLDLEQFVKHDYKEHLVLPKDLLHAQELISWSDHLVFVYPVWWGTPPALLKVFVEVVFQSGFAYKYQESTGMAPKWDKMLADKSARVIVTMDSPTWYHTWFVGDPGFKMMKNSILNFCGVSPVQKSYFGSVKMSSEKQRKEWLEKSYAIGLHEK